MTTLKYLVVNTKNYLEAAGKRIFQLADPLEQVAEQIVGRVNVILAPPALCVASLSQTYRQIDVFLQHVDDSGPGSTTGYLSADVAREFGAKGSIVNHNEHRIPPASIKKTVRRLRELGMKSIVCARTPTEVSRFAAFRPDMIAIEPPELIGSGIAVSKARPTLITNSRKALDSLKRKMPSIPTFLLCGAGIISVEDVSKAVELGSEGVLVASGIVKAPNWSSQTDSLVRGLIA